MAIKMIPVVCPNCKADLNIEEGRNSAFCSYCGTKILVEDTNKYTQVNIIRNEAEIEKAKADKEIELRKIDAEEKKTEEKRL